MIPDIIKIKEYMDRNVFKLVLYSIIGVLTIAVIILMVTKEDIEGFDTYTVVKGDFDVVLSESAEIKAVQSREIRMPWVTSGGGGYGRGRGGGWDSTPRQIIFMAEEGVVVQEGDTLIKFDVSDLVEKRITADEELITARDQYDEEIDLQKSQKITDEKNVQNTNFSLENAKLNLQLAQFESEITKKEMQLQLDIARIDSKKVQVEIGARVLTRQYRLENAENAIDAAQNTIDSYDFQINLYTVLAPFSGLVVYTESGWPTPKKVQLGDTPYPMQTLMQLPDLSSIKATIYVNDLDINNIWNGQTGRLRLESYPDEVYTGKVTRIAYLSQKTTTSYYSNLKVVEVELLLDEANEKFRPGMSAHAELVVDNVKEALIIPMSSVFEFDGSPSVLMDNGDLREVQLGRYCECKVEVLSGLDEGDEIVTNPYGIGTKLGFYGEIQNRMNELVQFQEHFEEIKNLGIEYDYDANRGKPADTGRERGAGSRREISDDMIKRMLERQGLDATPENMKRTREMIQQRMNSGDRSGRGGGMQGMGRRGGERGGTSRGGSAHSSGTQDTKPDSTGKKNN
ncbi:MAG: HlyD family efflux transporter periplasmic adaptor subunit [bacterium]|nr:HlyD family efflux transporter periplasmic adaptor subunit [bacterium]